MFLLTAAVTAIAVAATAKPILVLMPFDFLVEGLLHFLNHLADSFAILDSVVKVLFALGCLSPVLEGFHELVFALVTK